MPSSRSLCSLACFLALFYIVDVARLYLEHEWSIYIDRLFTWLVPTILFVAFSEKDTPLSFLKLNNNVAKGILIGLLVGTLQGALHLGYNYIFKGEVSYDLNFEFHVWWDVIITVGIVEEIVFRGLVLQRIWKLSNFWNRQFGERIFVYACAYSLQGV